jgi:hypothetical protein
MAVPLQDSRIRRPLLWEINCILRLVPRQCSFQTFQRSYVENVVSCVRKREICDVGISAYIRRVLTLMLRRNSKRQKWTSSLHYSGIWYWRTAFLRVTCSWDQASICIRLPSTATWKLCRWPVYPHWHVWMLTWHRNTGSFAGRPWDIAFILWQMN